MAAGHEAACEGTHKFGDPGVCHTACWHPDGARDNASRVLCRTREGPAWALHIGGTLGPSGSCVRAVKVPWTVPSPDLSSQPPSSARGNLGTSPWDASRGALPPLTICSPSPQRRRAPAPPLSCHPPPLKSATRGPWWAAGPWQCVGQLDWSWLLMVSSLFSEYSPNRRGERWSGVLGGVTGG